MKEEEEGEKFTPAAGNLSFSNRAYNQRSGTGCTKSALRPLYRVSIKYLPVFERSHNDNYSDVCVH
jgi:hypothetical protein